MTDRDEHSLEEFFKQEAARIKQSGKHRMSKTAQKFSDASSLSGASRLSCPACKEIAIEYARLPVGAGRQTSPGDKFECRHCGEVLKIRSQFFEVELGLSVGLYVCAATVLVIFPEAPLFDSSHFMALMLLGPGALGLFFYHIGACAVRVSETE